MEFFHFNSKMIPRGIKMKYAGLSMKHVLLYDTDSQPSSASAC